MSNNFNDIGEQWLRDNDPLYGTSQSNYLTSERINKIHRKEIPFSAIKSPELCEIIGEPITYSK